MSKLVWDQTGERFYETGVDHGVLYPQVGTNYPKGVVWNGLTNISESPSGGESNAIYADNIKYLNLVSAEDFGLTVEAYTYPDEFAKCDGSAFAGTGLILEQQARQAFGLSYRTKIGNDVDDDLGYKIHLVYGGKASPSEKSRATVNDSPEATQFSWEVATTPVVITKINPDTEKVYKPTAHLILDSTMFKTTEEKAILKSIEDILYGTDSEDARLPLPDELITKVTGSGEQG